MVSTAQITASMFPELYDSILRDWKPIMSRDEWRQAFLPLWRNDEDHFGYALVDGGRIVGMLGMLFSQRPVAGRTRRFCNLHCWHVKPEFRAKSLALLRPVLDLKDHVVTDFTPSPAVVAIARRLGFQPLDATVMILPRMPLPRRRSSITVCELQGSNDPQAERLNAADRQIYLDHQDLNCGHAVVGVGNENCYIVYSRISRHALPYCLIHYVSNPRLFAEVHACIRGHLLRAGRSRYAVIEKRLLGGVRLPWALSANAHPKLYRGTGVAPNEIDTLYSEMAIFKHSPLPSMRTRLKSTVKRCIPAAVRQLVGVSVAP